jgi:hypothetical protein
MKNKLKIFYFKVIDFELYFNYNLNLNYQVKRSLK